MKNRYSLLIIVLFTLVSCKKDNQENFGKSTDTETTKKISGQELFEGKGNCVACHKPDQKIIGPSIAEIAKIYKENKGSIVAFLKEEAEPIVDPSQYDIMKTNFAITKTMSDEELQALEDYIYSYSK
ncbi:c-type cytochrome [Flavobacterium sp. 25HG05S-40]|uniref:c-type cytochrome n=1 Tax=Flavobacterium sp. 25HG05S-40 TaxID=3458682 RepID=UPI004044723C